MQERTTNDPVISAGIVISGPLLLSLHTDSVYKKVHLLRIPKTFDVSKDISTLVYRTLIESILTFNISSSSTKHNMKLSHITNQESKIIGSPQKNPI